MGRAHLGAAVKVLHALDRFALGRDRPEASVEVDLVPTGEAQFAGADEDQQGQLDSQAGQRSAAIGLCTLQELGQPLQLQGRPVSRLARRSGALEVASGVALDQAVLHRVAHDAIDVLAQPACQLEVIILLGSFKRHQQVAHLQLGHMLIAQCGEQMLFHTPQYLCSVILRPFASAGGVPVQGNIAEGAGHCSRLGLLLAGVFHGVDALGQQGKRFRSAISRGTQPQCRVAAEGGQPFPAIRPVELEAPGLGAVHLDQQEQALPVEELVVLVSRACRITLGITERGYEARHGGTISLPNRDTPKRPPIIGRWLATEQDRDRL